MENIIRNYLKELLDINVDEVKNDSNLIEFGLNSLALMFILGKLIELTKKKFEYAEFVSSPTINDWLKIIENHN
ncbi:phosphopantetheine-binding protein [Providencia sp. PROV149]|uniref:phosphopantetheine-binding protein n=1 Tax=Providencia sp. PROV149 TaxID=2949859 RepID=UPI002349DE18|nr:phosphopantetheine-binding protein [Providencia sp. PROV149]